MSVLATEIHLRRVELGMTQTELAVRSGCTKATISRIERSALVPSCLRAARIGRALAWTPAELGNVLDRASLEAHL
jgi:transcriptional regulator with XRE-family HTH domain